MQSYRRLATWFIGSGLLAGGLVACSTPPSNPSSAHLREADAAQPLRNSIPAPVQTSAIVPKPRPAAKTETYSVVVNNIKAQELLFALARDAKVNIDIHPGIQGTVTLNAIDQTLQQLLARIAKQVDMRWELDGPNLAVMPDTPFLRTYKVDYVNMSRDATTTVSANSQITSGISGAAGASGMMPAGGASGNVSVTKVDNKVSNHFWESLERNIKDLLRETDKLLPEGSSETVTERTDQQSTTGTGAVASAAGRAVRAAVPQGIAGSPNPAQLQQDETTVTRRVTFREAASVIVNAETGIVTVRATGRQHEKIQEFLDQVTASARRQVMIEATIVEVDLNDSYQQGIDWSRTRTDGSGFLLKSPTSTNTVNQASPFQLSYINEKNPLDIKIALSLLEQFGNVKVLSSPRLSVLNNQSALLKVVENKVYFTVKADLAAGTLTTTATKAVTTTPQSVSVGLVMTVTPQISDSNSITLNVRPSITSISNYVPDPSPELRDATGARIPNQIPEIKTREMESVMRVEDGEIAVLGGLMQERAEYNTGRVPGAGAIPLFGEIFTSRNNLVGKSELVIFLRPVVIRDPSVNGDYRRLKGSLPGDGMFTPPPRALPFGLTGNSDGAH
ncbi:MAG: pilus (MSHA type) biogenesis protein MshL [Rhodocyclaceae bacterium]|nr:pilus (MSHA type) biogenesis protein MshL [Rhodocyclaceae bacterium]